MWKTSEITIFLWIQLLFWYNYIYTRGRRWNFHNKGRSVCETVSFHAYQQHSRIQTLWWHMKMTAEKCLLKLNVYATRVMKKQNIFWWHSYPFNVNRERRLIQAPNLLRLIWVGVKNDKPFSSRRFSSGVGVPMQLVLCRLGLSNISLFLFLRNDDMVP
jgi:hypothetical protein